MIALRILAVVLAVLFVGDRGQAQTSFGNTIIRPGGPQYGFVDDQDDSRFVWVFLDGVEVIQETRTLKARTLVLILARGRVEGVEEPPPEGDAPTMVIADSRILEIYMDGQVSVVEGDETIGGASAYHFDNVTGVATILEGELRTSVLAGQPLVVRYKTLRQLQDGSREMTELTYTSCDYGHPHWHISSPWAHMTPTPDGRMLETGGNTLRLGSVPSLWWPGFNLNVDRDTLLLRSISMGSSSRFGTEIEVQWEFDATGVATALSRLFGAASEVTAQWQILTAWYSDRGFFIEPVLVYETPNSKGRILGAKIVDKADVDHLGDVIPNSKRGRFDLEHRTRIDEHTTVDVEISYQSDRNFLNEYYEGEFRQEKQQETYISYRKVVDNVAITVLGRKQLNDFDTQVEYLPQVERRVTGQAVGDVLFGEAFVTIKDFISNARLVPDEDTGDPIVRNLRTGRMAEIAWPFDLDNGDRIVVTGQADVTHFQHVEGNGSNVRTAFAGGVEWQRTYSGTSDAQSEVWNINGLRRIVQPRVGYFNRFSLSHDSMDLLAIDDIETLARANVIVIGVRDRIQTHQNGRVVTILDTDLWVPYYLNPNRDNGGDEMGPLNLYTVWRPGANVIFLRDAILRWRTEYSIEKRHWIESFASFQTSLTETVRVILTNNKVFQDFNFLTVALEWWLNPKWSVAVFHQTDTRKRDTVRSGIVLRQTAHRWFIDLEISTRRDESAGGDSGDELSASIRFTPAIAEEGGLIDRVGRRARLY